MTTRKDLSPDLLLALHDGLVIPAHPLALNKMYELDERYQRALTRYYLASGVGGVAVGVHSTQFEIRDHDVNLYEPVLRIASEEVNMAGLTRPCIKIAGICGPTEQAVYEAEVAVGFGYDMGLLSMGGLADWTESQILKRAQTVAETIPIFGFYLQPSVGGRVFSFDFWKEFANIEGVMAIKLAPFNRYQTLDVVRAVCCSDRCDQIALYTGNDDNYLMDLLTVYRVMVNGTPVEKRIVGGLLGQWAVWTKKAVELLEEIKQVRKQTHISTEWMTRNIQMTDVNSAIFDTKHNFAGCIPGIHEVLRRQGLLRGTWCLNKNEVLSPGQIDEIDRVYQNYLDLNDDEFVKTHVHEWLSQ